jgi:hypothetical protein
LVKLWIYFLNPKPREKPMPTLMSRDKLFPKSVMDSIPRLGTQEEVEDPMCVVKFFDAMGAATWWVVEYDGEDMCFGYATLGDPQCAELGYFSLDELASAARMFERDFFWTPKPLSQVVKSVQG